MVNKQKQLSWISWRYSFIFNDLSDVKLVCADKAIQAHDIILSLISYLRFFHPDHQWWLPIPVKLNSVSQLWELIETLGFCEDRCTWMQSCKKRETLHDPEMFIQNFTQLILQKFPPNGRVKWKIIARLKNFTQLPKFLHDAGCRILDCMQVRHGDVGHARFLVCFPLVLSTKIG